MPKIKTSRAAAKRFKTTGTGNLRKATVLDQSNVKNMKKILPYL